MKIIDEADFESFSSFFKGEKGHRRAEFLMRMFAIDKINRVYNNSGAYSGAEFASQLQAHGQ